MTKDLRRDSREPRREHGRERAGAVTDASQGRGERGARKARGRAVEDVWRRWSDGCESRSCVNDAAGTACKPSQRGRRGRG